MHTCPACGKPRDARAGTPCACIELAVACVDCGRAIPAARAILPVSHGRCADCNAPNLHSYKQARMPEYETAVWSRGERL